MNEPRQDHEPKPLRMVFELGRSDNPRLYDELARFPQGVKRVNRLRVLAYDGLLTQHGVFAQRADAGLPPLSRAGEGSNIPAVTKDVFGPGV